MTKAETKLAYPQMQNPGDPGFGDRMEPRPTKHVLIVSTRKGVLVDPSKFDAIVLLNGHDVNDEDEQTVLKETTLGI